MMQYIQNYWWLWTIGIVLVCLYEFFTMFAYTMELKQRTWYSIAISAVLFVVFMTLFIISHVLNMISCVKGIF